MTSSNTPCDAQGPDWPNISAQLNAEGWALLPGLINEDQCEALTNAIAMTGNDRRSSAVANRVALAHANLGQGDRLFLSQPLPALLASWQTALYARLAPIANQWAETRGLQTRYAENLEAFQAQRLRAGYALGQASVLQLREEDFLSLHLDSQTDLDFPLQLVGLLSRPGHDFTGGEFVMTEQRPRMQSRAMVLPWRQGDIAIIAAGLRPYRGASGYYNVTSRHGISRVRSGLRLGLSLRFHDAQQASD